jgi:hypothetical protein
VSIVVFTPRHLKSVRDAHAARLQACAILAKEPELLRFFALSQKNPEKIGLLQKLIED